MCLAPQMPAPPEAPPPAPAPVTESKVTAIQPAMSARQTARRAVKGPSSLQIPLSTGGMSTSAPNLSIGK